MNSLPCFKAYDVRGRVPDELDSGLARRIGRAFAAHFRPRAVAVGHDVRLSSPELCRALAAGLAEQGVDVLHIGQCGTEEIYFAAGTLEVDGGIMVTASHNPADDNGMKFVRKGAVPVSGDSGLREIEHLAADGLFPPPATGPGTIRETRLRPAYIDHLLSWTDPARLAPLTLVVNAGNGCAGPVIDALEERLPFTFVKLQHQPDGAFPNGVPNPLLPENRAVTAEAVRRHNADLGIAWDGDFDRCFLFDETGAFIEGYYIVGLLARAVLAREPGARIVHDPRLVFNTREVVARGGGTAVMAKTGHAFIKERMRREKAAYGGEMSGHHYFRDFFHCDSGMIPWLLTCELLSTTGNPLSALVGEFIRRYPVSGEINRRVTDPDAVLAAIEERYQEAGELDHTDGVSVEGDDFRFNVRKSNTEPLLRLNVETRGDRELCRRLTAELLALIDSFAPRGGDTVLH